ncbi:MAG: phosphatidate cytidylyltransferase [Sediminibacterium sp.]|jgi:phosphatidate cytidylyltransferase|nr:phosphatidate cytidylyltransferase [Sediminibacterium sp.]
MALNVAVFKTRTISAIVFGIIMMAGLMLNEWSFFILFTIIQFGCLNEYIKLMGLIYPEYHTLAPTHRWGLLLVGIVMMMVLSPNTLSINGYSIKYIGSQILPVLLVTMVAGELYFKKYNLQNVAISFFGLIYIPMCLSLMFQLRAFMVNTFFINWAFSIPLLLIVTIWINDTMAYIVGSFIGKRPLSSISPNKTWEGTIAGIIISVALVTKVLGTWIPIQEKYIFLMSLVAAIAGTFGDLFESKIKRMAGVKDSGSMMPGHGGFLDRFDSILFAVPFVWLVLQILF